eukprot:351571-Chlamydomonas_euryale.AAC.6
MRPRICVLSTQGAGGGRFCAAASACGAAGAGKRRRAAGAGVPRRRSGALRATRAGPVRRARCARRKRAAWPRVVYDDVRAQQQGRVGRDHRLGNGCSRQAGQIQDHGHPLRRVQ